MNVRDEKTALQSFLENSDEFKKMRRIALTAAPHIHFSGSGDGLMEEVKTYPEKQCVEDLEKASSFADVVKVSDVGRFSKAPALAQVAMKGFAFFAGYVNDEANFFYHATVLREKALTVMAEQGYKADESPRPY